MKDKKEKLEGLLERLTELRKETDLYTTNLINEIKDIPKESKYYVNECGEYVSDRLIVLPNQ